ncbi:MAG: hypothetical protein M1820_006303 [Bogoriella megaspora]|nr:MAG: hypothetical protein M1820_006303 [Bogoriella megaspora]
MNGSAERQAFAIHEDVKIHMYCSEAPCGDASMELTMDAQDDPAPWEHPPDQGGTEDGQAFNLHGRGYFSELGAVRRKPARSDAPPTLSKSCSDKLALEQCTSLLSSLTSTLISPTNAYLNSLILPSSQRVPAAVQRAFNASGRMSALECDRKWSGGYDFRPFRVDVTKHEFKNSRRSARTGQKLTASNLSAVWSPHWEETLIGGILQGRKKGDLRGASKLCRRSMLQAVVEVTTLAGLAALRQDLLSSKRYKDFKLSNLCEERRVVKNHVKDGTLRGWIRNNDDDDWTIGPE